MKKSNTPNGLSPPPEFKETVKRIKDQKSKLEALSSAKESHARHQHYHGHKNTSIIKNIGEYLYWKHGGLYVGYLKKHPEYWS